MVIISTRIIDETKFSHEILHRNLVMLCTYSVRHKGVSVAVNNLVVLYELRFFVVKVLNHSDSSFALYLCVFFAQIMPFISSIHSPKATKVSM